jgi:hypothetical protein
VLELGNHLSARCVSEVEALYEGHHVGRAGRFSGVDVTPFGDISKERCVTQRRVRAPMPLARVPWEILNESCFKDPIQEGFFPWCRRIPGNLEGCARFLLLKNSHHAVVCRGDRVDLLRGGLDAIV